MATGFDDNWIWMEGSDDDWISMDGRHRLPGRGGEPAREKRELLQR